MAQAGFDIKITERIGEGKRAIVLTVLNENVIMLNREKFVTLEALEERLRSIYQIRSIKVISVQAADCVSYKYVIKVLDVVKGAGVETICIDPRRFRGLK